MLSCIFASSATFVVFLRQKNYLSRSSCSCQRFCLSTFIKSQNASCFYLFLKICDAVSFFLLVVFLFTISSSFHFSRKIAPISSSLYSTNYTTVCFFSLSFLYIVIRKFFTLHYLSSHQFLQFLSLIFLFLTSSISRRIL